MAKVTWTCQALEQLDEIGDYHTKNSPKYARYLINSANRLRKVKRGNMEDLKNTGLAINELHQKAMNLADEAFNAKSRQDLDQAQEKYLAAFEYEKAAALLLINEYDQEPTRSVFFRSAACLLLNLPYPKEEHFRQSEKMVAYGLSGNPPEAIAEELREAWRELMGHFQQAAA